MAPKRVAKSPARPSPAGKSPAKSTPPAKVKPPPKPPPSKFRKRAGYAALFLAILLGLMLRIPTYDVRLDLLDGAGQYGQHCT